VAGVFQREERVLPPGMMTDSILKAIMKYVLKDMQNLD
jgi:hypothetical protein